MDKRCPKCGEKMKFVYDYKPGVYATGRYYCERCSSMKKFVQKLNNEGYTGDGYKKTN